MSENQDLLRDRYGHNPSHWKRYAIILAIALTGWTLWAANHAAHPDVRIQLISFSTISDSKISIKYSVVFKQSSNQPRVCKLIARDFQKNVVGEIRDEFSGANKRAMREVDIPTRVKAVNASISGCV